MRPNLFRGPKWRGFRKWIETLFGISVIISLCSELAKDLSGIWPSLTAIIVMVAVIVVVVLGWLWFKRVRGAAEDGEFD